MWELEEIQARAKQCMDGMISAQEFLLEVKHVVEKLSYRNNEAGAYLLAKQLLKD